MSLNVTIAGTDYRLERESVTGCCVSLRDFEELGMQTCIPGLVLLVHIARQHGWLLRSCARIYHTVIMLSSHLAANQNKGVTCTYPGNQSGDHVIELSNQSVTCKNVFMPWLPPQPIWPTNAAILTILVPNQDSVFHYLVKPSSALASLYPSCLAPTTSWNYFV